MREELVGMKIENVENMSDLSFESCLKNQCKLRKRKHKNEEEFKMEFERMLEDEKL